MNRTTRETLGWLLLVALAFAAGLPTGAVAGLFLLTPDLPSVAPVTPEVVRVLDIVIRDSNTTGRRQHFECRPVSPQKRSSK